MALSASTPRGPLNTDERARAPVVDKSVPADSALVATTKAAHTNPFAGNPFALLSRFARSSAYPIPMLGEKTAAAVELPVAALRRSVVASARAVPQQFLHALIAANPAALRALPPTRLVLAALPGVTLDPQSYAAPPRARTNYAYLAYYAYSEAPPPEKPADTVLRAWKDIPEGTPVEEVRRAASAFGLDVIFMEAVAKIESGFDPKQRTGSYIGVFQLSQYEFGLYGSGDITDARDNAVAAAYKFAVAAILFELSTHKKATPEYLYLIHQQGTQGAAEHVAQPQRLAWESMCATDEGRLKGERWCKRAIWQNTLPDVKKTFGSVEKLTSAAFVTMWNERLATLYRRYAASASAAAAQH